MPKVSFTPTTDPVTPAKIEIALKPIRLLQLNRKVNQDNFHQESASTEGVPIHAGSIIRNISDIVDTAKTFDGKAIYTDLDAIEAKIGATSVYNYFRNTTVGNEKDFFTVHSRVCGYLYQEEHSVRDIEFKMSYTREDIKTSFRTRKEIEAQLKRLDYRLRWHALSQKKWERVNKERYALKEEYRIKKQAGSFDYEFITLSQSIEVELPTGYEFDGFEIFGDLDWGWLNEEGNEKLAVGVLYVGVDKSRDDFVVFKLSILFDQDVSLSEDDYVLCAGKFQYRVKRYA